ncbi:MAG: Crp/Fnr family transcriptional regulator [Taibaiella sp.]|nr:Crp/Fnr family transcriptional regulator [Taibaiella sp.]
MVATFIDHINSLYPISDTLKARLEGELEVITIDKKQHILKEGQRCDYAFFVMEGLLRVYYVKDDMEVCCRFIHENHIGLSINSFYTRRPGYEYIEALETSTIARIHHDKLQQLYKEYIEFNYVARIWTEHYASMMEHRSYMLRKQSAEERYLSFMEKYPMLLQRVPLKYIATYLGMTLETLSRMRSKVAGSR